jgi:hypothetical protein
VKIRMLVAALVLTLAGINGAAAAPRQLYGRSIILSWTEHREQRRAGETRFRSQDFQARFMVYVSPAGRVFSRVSQTNPRGKSGSVDRLGSTEGRNISFSGNSMVSVQGSGSGSKRRIVATFASDFASCTADVIRGKAQDTGIVTAKSIITPGATAEIRSVRTSNVTCAVQNRNVFDNE